MSNIDKIRNLELQMNFTTKVFFEWKIENYASWAEEFDCGESSYSDEFLVHSKVTEEPYRLKLEHFPSGDKDVDKPAIFMINKSKKNINCKFSLFLKTKDGSLENLDKDDKSYNMKSQANHGIDFPKSRITNGKKYLHNEALTICCIVEVIGVDQNQKIRDNSEFTKTIHDLYKETFDTSDPESSNRLKEFSDFEIICGEDANSSLFCHKIILATGSPVFRAMFLSINTSESIENKLILTDIKLSTMRKLLHYLYTGSIKEEMISPELFYAADKYQIDNLKVKCENTLALKINLDNIHEILVQAYLCGSTSFKNKVLKFTTSKWKSISKENKISLKAYPDLLLTIIEQVTD